MTTITYAGGPVITPTLALIDTASVVSEARTVVHDILDGEPVHTLRPASPLRGRLVLGFLSEQEALDCLQAHRLASVFTIASDVTLVNFRYIVTGGELALAPDEDTQAGWVLEVPYQEVS